MLYSIAITVAIGALIWQIKAAKEILVCGKSLPIMWSAVAIANLLFALDSIPNIHYMVLFLSYFIVMAISAEIAWQKVPKG